MVYREPDETRTREVEEDAENRAALERLAQAGLRKKNALARAAEDARIAERTKTSSSAFLRRALVKPRTLLFVPFWFGACAAVAIASGIVALVWTDDLSWAVAVIAIAFICANASAMSAFPVVLLFALWKTIWKRRDARDLVVWNAALPVPYASFVETLSLDRPLSELRIIARFEGESPPAEIVDGLLGNLAEPRTTTSVRGKHGVAIYRESLSDSDEQCDLVPFIRELTEKVLLPLHAVHAIARLELAEGSMSERIGARDASNAILANLNAPVQERRNADAPE
jgi:hypothetical protein